MPEVPGEVLTQFPAGSYVRIVHVEDEPPAMYDRLVAIGMHHGLYLEALENTSARVRIEAQGEEHVVEPALARLITAVRAPADQRRPSSYMALSALGPGDVAQVSSISRLCRGQQRRRLISKVGSYRGHASHLNSTVLPATRAPIWCAAPLSRCGASRRAQIFVTPVRGAA